MVSASPLHSDISAAWMRRDELEILLGDTLSGQVVACLDILFHLVLVDAPLPAPSHLNSRDLSRVDEVADLACGDIQVLGHICDSQKLSHGIHDGTSEPPIRIVHKAVDFSCASCELVPQSL